MIYVCFFINRKLDLRRIKKTILFLIRYNLSLFPVKMQPKQNVVVL